MRIACPSCNAVYQVPDEQLGAGQLVRCARCGTDWSPVVAAPVDDGVAGPPPEVLPEVAPQVVSGPSPVTEPEMPVRRMALDDDVTATVTPVAAVAAPTPPAVRRGMPWLAIAWVVSVLAVIGGVAALVVWREAVMQAWPPSIRAYVAVGLVSRP